MTLGLCPVTGFADELVDVVSDDEAVVVAQDEEPVLEAQADGAYSAYLVNGNDDAGSLKNKTVRFNGRNWYVIEDESSAPNAGTLTLLAKDGIGKSVFHESSNSYSESEVKGYLDKLTAEGGEFAGVKDAIVDVDLTDIKPNVTGAKFYLLSQVEASKMAPANGSPSEVLRSSNQWWLRTPKDNGVLVVKTTGYISADGANLNQPISVRPALKLDLKSVVFNSETKMFRLRVNVTGVSIEPSEAQTIDVGGKVTFAATVEPKEAADSPVAWSSSDTGVATVDENGVVTGVAPGTATITVTSVDNPEAKASCDVTVTTPKSAPAGIPPVSVTAHVQRRGTLAAVSGGAIAGTTGKSLRMESIKLTVDGASETGGIEYRGHVQRKGWETSWARDGAMAGTEGKSRRMEAVQIRLWGDMADKYDVYYRVHSQRYGWMGWAKNGEEAGTQGMSRRAEAIQVVLVKKDAPAPDSTYKGVTQQYAKAFVKK